jgi:hypothetical protein
MRIAVFMLAGWPGLPAGAAYRAHEGLSNGHWMDGMRKFTLLLKQAPGISKENKTNTLTGCGS